jgi:hypothetical protein
MCHHYVLKSVDVGASDFRPVILPKTLNPLEHNQPSVFERKSFALDLASDEVCYVLEHADC